MIHDMRYPKKKKQKTDSSLEKEMVRDHMLPKLPFDVKD
jgi:hypothetical protein